MSDEHERPTTDPRQVPVGEVGDVGEEGEVGKLYQIIKINNYHVYLSTYKSVWDILWVLLSSFQ